MSLGYSSFSASSVTIENAGGGVVYDAQLNLEIYDLSNVTSLPLDFSTLVEDDSGTLFGDDLGTLLVLGSSTWTHVDVPFYGGTTYNNDFISINDQIPWASVPEPLAFWLPLVALLGVCAYRLRRSRLRKTNP
ncbi:hypothetical protein [Cerasicoccus maritimus]|uniref:hypothetical protein n=1 Tax=Cerasicoccus maritimus TaxID=490089 RepID=UPI0028524A47|nr:hypothetical protein [Cerasicoccus maritimus]